MSSDNKRNEASQRRQFSPEQKIKILREHLLGKTPISEVCEKHQLTSRGFKPTAQDAVILETVLRTRALDDLAHDDHGAQTALGLMVGGRDVGPAEAGEEVLLLRARQTLAEGPGLLL